MAETPKRNTAPYATFSSFINFINKLKESGVPNRIDPSVFGNASGSISYSIIAALKTLKLIDENGTPTERFVTFVNSEDGERPPMMRSILRNGYPSLWSDEIDLTTITAGQFDDHLRQEYDVKGSTVDKAATFFIAAAKFADEPISAHLKARKPIAASSSSKKSASRRKKNDDAEKSVADANPLSQEPPQKPLQYQLIDLMSEPDFPDDIKAPIWDLVQYLAKREANKSAAPEESAADD